MHLNIASRPYHFYELSELLINFTIKFQIMCITESMLNPLSQIWICEQMPTKTNKRGALLYISNELNN